MSPPVADPVNVYGRMRIAGASHERLVCMLHEQCSLTLRQALKLDSDHRRPLLDRAQNILALLERSLVPGDTTSQGLLHLYDYCYCRLEQHSYEEIMQARQIIDLLRKTFNELRLSPAC